MEEFCCHFHGLVKQTDEELLRSHSRDSSTDFSTESKLAHVDIEVSFGRHELMVNREKINFSLSIGGHWWLFANWWLSSREETVPRTNCLIIKCYLQIEEQNFRNGLGRFSTHSCSSGFCPWYALATLPPESPSGFRSTFFANCARVCGFLFCALTIFDLEENTMNDAYYGIDHKWQSRFETGFRGCEYVISEDTCQTCRLHRNILTPIADACRVVDL